MLTILRIGLNTGEVIGDRDDLFGNAANVAKRIEAFAWPGGTLILATTRSLVGASRG